MGTNAGLTDRICWIGLALLGKQEVGVRGGVSGRVAGVMVMIGLSVEKMTLRFDLGLSWIGVGVEGEVGVIGAAILKGMRLVGGQLRGYLVQRC